jgi:hypothetical protein
VLVGPLALAVGYGEVLMISGVVYVVVCGLVLLSPAVRRLPRAPAVAEEPAAA